MYNNVAANHSFCIDSLTRSFDHADAQMANFTKSFVIELTRRILDNDPGISVERKEQAVRRATRCASGTVIYYPHIFRHQNQKRELPIWF